MKSIASISKNLKLLFRSKESAYTIVFGPLLIILLVSFAFMGSSDEFTVHVGVHAAPHTDFSDRTVSTLNANGYLVSVYPDNETCVDSVRKGTTNACMAFHPGAIGEEALPVTFYVDLSRTNVVYQIIDDLSSELDIQTDAIREQLAMSDAVRLQTAAQLIDESYNRTASLAQQIAAIAERLSSAESSLSFIPSQTTNVTDLRLLKGYQQGLAQNTKEIAEEATAALAAASAMIRELESRCDDCPDGVQNDIDAVQRDINEAEDTIYYISDDLTDKQLEEAQLLLRFAIEDLENVQSTIDNVSSVGSAINEDVSVAAAEIIDGRSSIQRVTARLKYTSEFLRGERTDPSLLSSPVATSVVSITASDDTLSFAYPYLLVLVIMFIGILLGSTLIVTDKTSKAAFRNFTTPTSDRYHITMAFLTAFLILIAEVVVILLVSGIFVAQPLLLNPGATFLIVSVAIVIFTFLGMVVGYLASTHEAAMISSISIASVLLFVSNLVIPIEGMARFVQWLSALNPYIVLSELLKRSMLYGVAPGQIARELLTLAAFIAILFIVILLVQRRLKQKYFKEEQLLPMTKHEPKPLLLSGKAVHNEVELMDALDSMTRPEFEAVQHMIPAWAACELRNKRLARQLSTKSKERMILRLDKYLKRHGKRIKR